MVKQTSACCQIWLSLIREKAVFKLKHLEKLKIQMRAPKTAAYYISPIEMGLL